MAVPPADRPTRPLLGALAVVLRDDCALLAQRGRPPDPLHWGFPGGHVELGETALEAATRELREETGVIARPRGYLTNVDVLRQTDTGETGVHYLLAAVLCEYISGDPVADDDIIAARWVGLEDIAQARLPLHDGVQLVTDLARRRLRNW